MMPTKSIHCVVLGVIAGNMSSGNVGMKARSQGMPGMTISPGAQYGVGLCGIKNVSSFSFTIVLVCERQGVNFHQNGLCIVRI